MKFRIAALLMLLPVVASAKDKNDPPDYAPVYNLTGTITKDAPTHYDHYTTVTVGNRSETMGCNFTDTNTDCAEATPTWHVKLSDGLTRVLGIQTPPFRFHLGKYTHGDYSGNDFEVGTNPLIDQLGGERTYTFQYRLVTIKGKDNLMAGDYCCIQSPAPMKHGFQAYSGQYEEFCYRNDGIVSRVEIAK